MPCHPIKNGVICTGNEPVVLAYRGQTYRVEWTAWGGWVPMNKDGSGRESPLPKPVWLIVDELERPE